MRHQLVFGAATLAATAALSLAVNGLATSQLPGVTRGGPLGPPAAAADELESFADCDALLDWYVARALPDVGPWGWDWGWGPMPLPLPLERSASSGTEVVPLGSGAVVDTHGYADAPVGSSDTGTNVQEMGVDEPDRAKSDGELVVHLRDDTLVVTDVGGAGAREIGTLDLPRQIGMAELVLAGETVLVVGQPHQPYWGRSLDLVGPGPDAAVPFPGPGDAGTSRLLEVSLSEPANPRLLSDQTFGGSLVSARMHTEPGDPGGTVRMVLRTGHPPLDFVYPNRNRSEKEAEEANRRIVRNSTVEDWLPTVQVGDGERTPLLDCGAVRHPSKGADLGTLSILTFPADDPTSFEATAVTAGGETVYSSADRLYLATTVDDRRTDVHAFTLDADSTTYVASGSVRGVVKDRWSLDEHDGLLRVAASYGGSWDPDESGIEVLREDGDSLVPVGSVRGLGPDEQIKSVRWFDDLAVVVTFRQTDPLYTVDLSDPTRPQTRGALKVEGFSTYLHPVGRGLLLGLGHDATFRGRVLGAQASVFDVSDLADPTRVDRLFLGRDLTPVVDWEPRAFTWLADEGTALTALSGSWRGGARVAALTVSADGTLVETRSWDLPDHAADLARTLPLADGSVALVTDEVRLVDLP